MRAALVIPVLLAIATTSLRQARRRHRSIQQSGLLPTEMRATPWRRSIRCWGPCPASARPGHAAGSGRDAASAGGPVHRCPRVPTSITMPGGDVPGTASASRGIASPAVTRAAPSFYGTLELPKAGGRGAARRADPRPGHRAARPPEPRPPRQVSRDPQARADVLTASLRANPILYADSQLVPYGSFTDERPGGPTQYDLNVSHPIDYSHKRQAQDELRRGVARG